MPAFPLVSQRPATSREFERCTGRQTGPYAGSQGHTSTGFLGTLTATFEGKGLSNSPAVVAWAQRTAQNIEIPSLGAAGHHAPEEAPGAIVAWLDRHPR